MSADKGSHGATTYNRLHPFTSPPNIFHNSNKPIQGNQTGMSRYQPDSRYKRTLDATPAQNQSPAPTRTPTLAGSSRLSTRPPPARSAYPYERRRRNGAGTVGSYWTNNTARTNNSIHSFAGQRNTTHKNWKIGQIVWIEHIAPALDDALDDKYVLETRNGQKVCTKPRPVLILAKLETHLLVAPMYTSGGKGVTRKSAESRAFAMSIMNPNETRPEAVENLTNEVLFTNGSWYPLPQSYLNLTDAYYQPYSCKISMRGVGFLDQASEELLRDRFKLCWSLIMNSKIEVKDHVQKWQQAVVSAQGAARQKELEAAKAAKEAAKEAAKDADGFETLISKKNSVVSVAPSRRTPPIGPKGYKPW